MTEKYNSDIRATIGMAKISFGQIRKTMISLSINIKISHVV